VAFALGFVLLGVGSGSTGLSDIFQNAFNIGGGGGTSISKLEGKVTKHPQDATSWRDLATAYETKHRTQDAINALERYTALRPKDASALSELASQYTTVAQSYAVDYQSAQADAQLASPSSVLSPSADTLFPKGLTDPIGSVAASAAQTRAQTAFTNYQGAQQSAESTLQRLAKLTPKDVTVQYQLGQAASAAGDPKTAVKAYETFLKLAPNDVDAAAVKNLLKAAKAQAASASSQTNG